MNNFLLQLLCCFVCGGTFTSLRAQSADCLTSVDDLVEQKHYSAAADCYFASAEATDTPDNRATYALAASNYYRRAEVFDSARIALELVTNLPANTSRSVDSMRALAFHTLGLVYYKTDELRKAVAATKMATTIRDGLYENSHADRGRSYYSLGFYYQQLNELDSAETALQESYLNYSQAPQIDTSRLIRTLNTLATVYSYLNDRQLVASSVAQIVALSNQYYRDDPYELGDAYYRSAFAMSDLGLSDLLIEYAGLAADYYHQDGAYEWEGEALNVLASGYLEKQEYRTALAIFQRALDLWLNVGYYVPGTAGCYYNMGVCHYKIGEWQAAKQSGLRAIELESKEEEDLGGLSMYHLLVGTSTAQLEEYAAASASFDRSIGLLLDGGDLPPADQIPTDLLLPLANILDDRATFHVLSGQLAAANADYQTCFALQDRIRSDLNNTESQRYISERLRPLFERAIALQQQLFINDQDEAHIWEALILAERAKAFSLLAALQTSKSDQPRRERELRRQIAKLERGNNKAALGVAQLELERLLQLASGQEFTPEPLNPQALKNYLTERDLHLLEYLVGEEKSYLFHVTPTGDISMIPLDFDADLAAEIARFRQLIEASAYKEVSLNQEQKKLDLDFKVASLAMRSKVLPPLSPRGEPLPQRLLIIPDNYLAFIPFGALLTQPVADELLNYQTLPYLQRGRQLSFSYSAQYLLELAERESPIPASNLLAFAPTFSGSQSASMVNATRSLTTPNQNQRSLPGLLPLRYNQDEVRQIAEIVPSTDAFLGITARRAVFENLASDYRFLHLSSHALVDADDPNQSFIAFSQQGDSLEVNEMLYLNDLYTLNLNAELAVLSACETSMGRYAPGEGVLSLARAFAQAGAASTLTTLWKVDDEATKELMIKFYAALDAGENKSEAVAAAFAHATASPQFAHPYFWSALTLYGAPDQVNLAGNTHSRWIFFASLALISLLALGGYILHKRK